VKNDYRTEKEAWELNGLEQPFKKKNSIVFRLANI
jgi:hypothetical protein